jgi:hypothetical protein
LVANKIVKIKYDKDLKDYVEVVWNEKERS